MTVQLAHEAVPRPETIKDERWAEKIERAKEAREQAKRVRKDKQPVSPARLLPPK